MPGSSSWMSYATKGVKGFDDNKNCDVLSCGHCIFRLPIRVRGSKNVIIDFLSRSYTRNCPVSEIYFYLHDSSGF